ncbi:hypothetical protein BDV06DRAFT_60989 [Aspergillus oleicola]
MRQHIESKARNTVFENGWWTRVEDSRGKILDRAWEFSERYLMSLYGCFLILVARNPWREIDAASASADLSSDREYVSWPSPMAKHHCPSKVNQ